MVVLKVSLNERCFEEASTLISTLTSYDSFLKKISNYVSLYHLSYIIILLFYFTIFLNSVKKGEERDDRFCYFSEYQRRIIYCKKKGGGIQDRAYLR